MKTTSITKDTVIKKGDIVVDGKDGAYPRKVITVIDGAIILEQHVYYSGQIYTIEGLSDIGYYLQTPEWEPEIGAEYFFIGDGGNTINSMWDNISHDNNRKNFMGILKTREEAQARLEEIKKLLKK